MKLGKWRTRDGRVLDIAEMGTVHIQRCIAMIDRMLDVENEKHLRAPAYLPEELAVEDGRQAAIDALLARYVVKKRELQAELAKRA